MKPLFAFLLLMAVGTGAAAIPPQGREATAPPRLSIRTDLVTLPVSVVDLEGRFVTGLGREQFTVYDNSEPQAIEFFTSEDLPLTIGLVVDSSASMSAHRNNVTAAAAAFAAMSDPLDEFFTVNFNERVWLGLPGGVAFTEDWGQLRAAMAAAPAYGMTALYDAVDRALEHVRLGTHERKALIVVSDGGDNASSHTRDAVLQHARHADTVIYAVVLMDRDDHEANPRVLKALAKETGGRAFAPRNADEVIHDFEQIARETRSGYTIGFAPSESDSGGLHLVRVSVDARDRRPLTARTRAGYYVEPTTAPER
jgi:Ca-activated chloride channel family protein